MAKHRDKWQLDPDQPPSLKERPPSPYEAEVKAHWERFQPALVQQLKAQGPQALDQAVRNQVHRAHYQEALTLARNPKLHPDQVKELFRDQVFLPPGALADRPAPQSRPPAPPEEESPDQ